MAEMTYVAKRDINTTDSPAHEAGETYVISFSPKVHNVSRKIVKTRKTSISGLVQDTLKRIEIVEDVTVTNLSGSSYRDWIEFLGSVSGGEKFWFELFADSPPSPSQYRLVGNIWGAERIVNRGTGGGDDDVYQVSFKMRTI